jgi:hypothetical protein
MLLTRATTELRVVDHSRVLGLAPSERALRASNVNVSKGLQIDGGADLRPVSYKYLVPPGPGRKQPDSGFSSIKSLTEAKLFGLRLPFLSRTAIGDTYP